MDGGRSILILMESEEARKDLALRLEVLGHKVFEAPDLLEAQALMRVEPVDLTLCDWRPGRGASWWSLLDPRHRPLVFLAEEGEAVPPPAALAAKAVLPRKARGDLFKKIQELLQERSSVGASGHAGNREILLIEDSASARGFIRRALEKTLPGCRVREAEDGRSALREMSRRKVDLIITDLQMPGMDGRTFLNHLGANPLLSKKPVVVLSGNITQDVRDLFRDAVNVRLLSKPATAQQVAILVVSLLNQERQASGATVA